jgi:hypothetical protein
MKYLIWLLLFYLVFRMLRSRVVVQVNQHHHYHNNTQKSKPEGHVTVDKIKSGNNGSINSGEGDYVEFEEIK